MKRINLCLIALITILFSCNQSTKEQEPVTQEETTNISEVESSSDQEQKSTTTNEESVEEKTEPAIQIENAEDFVGYWVGYFEAKEYDENKDVTWWNLINISIERIEDGKIYGRSVVAGNDRPFEGIVDEVLGKYFFEAKEPGDDKYDGQFSFHFEGDQLVGEWHAYDKNLPVYVREYKLEKREFEYNPNHELDQGFFEFVDLGRYKTIVEEYDDEVYYDEEIATTTYKIFEYNPSKELLDEDVVANMKKGDLQVLRNSIYARHGYSFKNKIYRTIFDNAELDWYIPVSTNVQAELTEIEVKNIELIKRYEDYAEDYYDVFGR